VRSLSRESILLAFYALFGPIAHTERRPRRIETICSNHLIGLSSHEREYETDGASHDFPIFEDKVEQVMKQKIRALLFHLSILMVLPLFLLTVKAATIGAPCTLRYSGFVGQPWSLPFSAPGIVVEGSDGTPACAPVDPESTLPTVPCGTIVWGLRTVQAVCPY
jgi:hypothetical protein